MKRLLLFALCAALLLALCGCTKIEEAINDRLPQAYDTDLTAMDTVIRLRIYDDRDGAAAAELSALLNELDTALSVTDSTGALYELNRRGTSENASILALLAAAEPLCRETGGAVDPTVYPAVRLWGFTGESYHVPLQSEIDEVLPLIGMEHVHSNESGVTLDEGSMLDFGAFAKGWAADRCAELLAARGLCGVLTLGGSVTTVGSKPEGGSWVIGVADPDQPDAVLLELRLPGGKSVATSGDYQRFFEYEGVKYCHIFDPETGRPADSGLRSVTVVADSGLTADALSTALFVMGPEGAAEFWRGADGAFDVILITDSGTILATEGLKTALGEQEVVWLER